MLNWVPVVVGPDAVGNGPQEPAPQPAKGCKPKVTPVPSPSQFCMYSTVSDPYQHKDDDPPFIRRAKMHRTPGEAGTADFIRTGKSEMTIYMFELHPAMALKMIGLGTFDAHMCGGTCGCDSLEVALYQKACKVIARANCDLLVRDGSAFKWINTYVLDQRCAQLQRLTKMSVPPKDPLVVVSKAFLAVASASTSPHPFDSQIVPKEQEINCYMTPVDACIALISKASFRDKEWEHRFRVYNQDCLLASNFRNHKFGLDPDACVVGFPPGCFHLAVVDIAVDQLRQAAFQDCPSPTDCSSLTDCLTDCLNLLACQDPSCFLSSPQSAQGVQTLTIRGPLELRKVIELQTGDGALIPRVLGHRHSLRRAHELARVQASLINC